jgi:hypothetical protein
LFFSLLILNCVIKSVTDQSKRARVEDNIFPPWESLCTQDLASVKTAQKLSLSAPNLFSQPVNKDVSEMYVRRCYIDLVAIMRKYLASSSKQVSGAAETTTPTSYKRMGVTGTPGIGKSAFIMYIIFDMLQNPPEGIS